MPPSALRVSITFELSDAQNGHCILHSIALQKRARGGREGWNLRGTFSLKAPLLQHLVQPFTWSTRCRRHGPTIPQRWTNCKTADGPKAPGNQDLILARRTKASPPFRRKGASGDAIAHPGWKWHPKPGRRIRAPAAGRGAGKATPLESFLYSRAPLCDWRARPRATRCPWSACARRPGCPGCRCPARAPESRAQALHAPPAARPPWPTRRRAPA